MPIQRKGQRCCIGVVHIISRTNVPYLLDQGTLLMHNNRQLLGLLRLSCSGIENLFIIQKCVFKFLKFVSITLIKYLLLPVTPGLMSIGEQMHFPVLTHNIHNVNIYYVICTGKAFMVLCVPLISKFPYSFVLAPLEHMH